MLNNDICNIQPSTHPGVILKQEFIDVYGITVKDITILGKFREGVIQQLLDGGECTVDTALRLSKLFGTTSHFWMNLQINHDMYVTNYQIKHELEEITKFFKKRNLEY